MSRIKSILVTVCLLFLLGMACVFTSCQVDPGEMKTVDVSLDAFDTVRLMAIFRVQLIEGPEYSMRIQGEEKLIREITWEVERQTLTIENSDALLWKQPGTEPPLLIITAHHLSRVHAEETCEITTGNVITTDSFGLTLGAKLNFADLELNCKLFYYWNTSPNGGLVTLRGHSDLVRIYNGNLMEINASQLICDEALVETLSKDDVHVHVLSKLYYSIGGTGNIYLSGNPGEIIAGEISSSGRLIQ